MAIRKKASHHTHGSAHVSVRHKTIKIHHHHNRAYRRRHVALLVISTVGILLLGAYSLRYLIIAQSEAKNARESLSNTYQTNDQSAQNVSSTYGFSFAYDPTKYYATAVDSASGGLYIGNELATNRAYEKLKLSTNSIARPQDQAAISMTYYSAIAGDAAHADYKGLEKTLVQDPYTKKKITLTRQTSSVVTLDGVRFTRTVWIPKVSVLVANLLPTTVTYIGIVNGHPLLIEVNLGLNTQDSASGKDLLNIIDTMQFGKTATGTIKPTSAVTYKKAQSLSLLDRLVFTGSAAAAEPASSINATEQISSLYGPAVVKVYNVYCTEIYVENKPYLNNVCNGGTGSAFFVSSDGYLATNGHVATSNPKDIVIGDAIQQILIGNTQYFYYLMGLAHINDSIFQGKTSKEGLAAAIDKFYDIPDSKFTSHNGVTNLLVDLNYKDPDLDELVSDTKNRKEYPEQDSIKHAKLITADYRAYDGINGFKASDVAIMKIKGDNFPIVKLGAISDVVQGSNLNILGYPAKASDNGLVDDTVSKVTLTAGKVSSIKNASESKKKLIETDTTIGHGNSGGPAFNDAGAVIGIATYTADGAGSGDGTYNYVRDIKDLQDLAAKKSITFNTTSETQDQWQKGIGYFNTSHYSKSLGYFKKVAQLYPQHPTVDSFIDTANKRIANGQDIKDFPVVPVAIVAVVLITGAGVAVFLIVRHKKTHNIYRDQVLQNNLQPVTAATSPQTATYDASQYSRMGQPTFAVVPPPPPQPSAPVQPQATQPPAPTNFVAQPAPSPQPSVSIPVNSVQSSSQPTVIQPQVTPQPGDSDPQRPNPPIVQ